MLCDRKSICFHSRDLRALSEKAVESADADVTVFTLNGDELAPCVGCYGCWIKTPGLCSVKGDVANSLSARFIQADTVILLSEICYGGYSYDMKSFLDRFIPNILPYFEIYKGQMHHKKRYECMPSMITIGYGDFCTDEAQIFKELCCRNALNIRPRNQYALTIQGPDDTEAVMHELYTVLLGESRSKGVQ